MVKSTNSTPKYSPTLDHYLVFKDYHFAKLCDLSPRAIKKSAKEVSHNSIGHVKKGREKVKTTTAQNWIVKTLGFTEGYSTYEKRYNEEIIPFFLKHGLKRRANLYTFQKKGYALPLTSLTPQRVSEKLFFGSSTLPQKIFTGYDFPFDKTISDGHYFVNGRHADSYANLNKYGIEPSMVDSVESISKDIAIIEKFGSERLGKINDDYYSGRSIADVVLGKYLLSLNVTFNLIGGTLIDDGNHVPVVEMYSPTKDESYKLLISCYEKVSGIFSKRIRQSKEGWLEVIPFNKNLVFLKGRNGEYDFVFKNIRDKPFVYNFDNGALKLSNLPSCINDYDFQRWHYFSHEGYRDLEAHSAEQFHYDNAGTAKDYPDSRLLKVFHQHLGNYEAVKHKEVSRLPLDINFKQADGTKLMVSDLINISQFEEFIENNPDYNAYRRGLVENQLEIDNQDLDKRLPVACTWYDALAFIKWIEKETRTSMKLLSKHEFEQLRKQGVLLSDTRPVLFDMDVVQNTVTFPHDLKWDNRKDGLKFILLNDFAEWVMERTCVRSGNLTSFYGDDCFRGGALDTTGAYKSTKIGFRLCYEVEV